MAKTRKSYRKGRNRARTKTSKARTSVAKKTEANARAITKIQKELYAWRQYQVLDVGLVSSKVSVDFVSVPQTWTGVFQAQHDSFGEIPRQFICKNVHFKYIVQTEEDSIGNLWFQVWLVTLKPKYARQVRERTANMTNLTVGDDYIQTGAGTHGALQGNTNFMLNPAYYSIKHTSGQQRIGQSTMGADTPVTNIRDSTYSRTGVIPFKRTFKVGEHESNGFLGLDADNVANNNCLYRIILSNAGSAVGEDSLFKSFQYLFMGQTVAGR